MFPSLTFVWKIARCARSVGVLYMHVSEPEHRDGFQYPRESLHSVTAAHTRWLSKKGPGGGAECSTVKRGLGACWHLPWPTAAGRAKICFSICLCSLQPFPPPTAAFHHSPLLPSLPRHNQMAPWTLFTLGKSPRCKLSTLQGLDLNSWTFRRLKQTPIFFSGLLVTVLFFRVVQKCHCVWIM